MTKQELIKTAKVTLTDKGRRSRKGEVIKTMIIEFETGYRFEWDWAFKKDWTHDSIAYRTEVAASNAYSELHKNCSGTPCADCMQKIYYAVNNPKFKYARFQLSGLGNYYNLYHKDDSSPTGVSLVGSCSEKIWEKVSRETGNSHNYLSPTENKMTTR